MSSTVFYEDANEFATLTNVFKVSGVATDPTTVSCVVTAPDGTETTYTYPADISKPSTGTYTLDVSCTQTGIWVYKWIGTGTAADVVVGTWTVSTAAVNTLYCSLEELKSRLGIADTDDDFEALFAIQAACRSIDDITGRYFWRGSDTRTYAPVNTTWLGVDDLVSITTLKTDDDADGVFETTWTTGNYQLLVAPGRYNTTYKGVQWPYTIIKAIGNFWPVPNPYGRDNLIEVAGVFGWPAVPSTIKQAALIAAADLFKIKDAPFGIAGTGEFAIRVRENARVMALITSYMNPGKVGV